MLLYVRRFSVMSLTHVDDSGFSINKCRQFVDTYLALFMLIWAYRTKSVCENPYNTRYLLVL